MTASHAAPRNAQKTLDVSVFLREAAALAEAALDRVLPAVSVAPERLHAAMRYSVFAGGKRVRPALALAVCRALGGTDRACQPALAALELLHTYTLIHDDLPAMDDDDLRRGRPTCHKAFDEATAILAGDALQCLAFEVLAGVEKGAGEAVACLARAAGSLGVVGGQQDDLEAEGRPVDAGEAGKQRLERIHRRKTAALIRASCELGALAARAPAVKFKLLSVYGEAVGLAFQIADDILDATADAATLGKTPGKDAAQGKLTYVAVYGLEAARAEASRREAEALAAIAPLGAHGDLLAALARFIVHRDR